jgi:sulfatase modifying factor 1
MSTLRAWPFLCLLSLLMVGPILACGGEETPPGRDAASDGGTDAADAADGGDAIDVTGDWLLLRYFLADAATTVPGQPDVSETRFVQSGATFVQYFGADDSEGIPGSIQGDEYVQSDGTFTARTTFSDADHGAGTFEAGEFAMRFAFVRDGAASHEVDGAWLLDEVEPARFTVAGDEVLLEVGDARLVGRVARDTALLVAEEPAESGSLAAVAQWTSDTAGTLTFYDTSWTPDGAGHSDYAQRQTSFELSRLGGSGCLEDGDCEETEECIQTTCEARVEGSPCDGDEACPGDLYCGSGACRDGSTGDPCDDEAECLSAEDLCDGSCRPRGAGEGCGPGDVCPGALSCIEDVCRAGERGDPCRSTTDCAVPGDACLGEPAVCAESMVLIEAGDFLMGSPESELGRNPIERSELQHPVRLSRSFVLAPYETTRAEFETLMGEVPAPPVGCSGECPVTTVTLYDAMAYANARSRAEGLPACYALYGCGPVDAERRLSCSAFAVETASGRVEDCVGYRLPTEAEWEFAARAGTTGATYAGDHPAEDCSESPIADIAWYCGAVGTLQPVGGKRPNDWGLYDMIGNAWEWTASVFEPYLPTSALDPIAGPVPGSEPQHVLRGGSFMVPPAGARAAIRVSTSAFSADGAAGFRLARTLPGQYGQPCDDDSDCAGDNYCAQGRCQDGRSGDLCRSGADCESDACVEVRAGSEPEESTPFGAPRCAPEGMVAIPGAVVDMGSPEGELGREASGLSETPFRSDESLYLWVSEHEVTQGEWRALVGTSPSEFGACGDDCPVENISWEDAVLYANARSLAEGLPACYRFASECDGRPGEQPSCGELRGQTGWAALGCPGYRIPNETEWEHIARAGTSTATPLGDLSAPDCRDSVVGPGAWFCGNAGGIPHPVGSREANDFGLYDTMGNVAEWVWDWAGDYPEEAASEWTGPTGGTERILRGGNYASTADRLRSASRESAPPRLPAPGVGLRLVRDVAVTGGPCAPFAAESGCDEGLTCSPTGRYDAEGEPRGQCRTLRVRAGLPGDACDEVTPCGPGSICLIDGGACVAYCDPRGDGAEGGCDGEASCYEFPDGPGVCIDECDAFEDFPSGGCDEGRWCSPIRRDPAGIEFVCLAPQGASPQGALCGSSAECAVGHVCTFGRCNRLCDPYAADTCGAGRSCHVGRTLVDGELVDNGYGTCIAACDYDRGVTCASAADMCATEEATLENGDTCAALETYWRRTRELELGETCERYGEFCSPNGACLVDSASGVPALQCEPLCRQDIARVGEGYHPDCGEGARCASLGGPRFGQCLDCVLPETLVKTGFDDSVGRVFDDASIEGWADGNYPTFADDESTGGSDGDEGLALHGWVAGGSGGWTADFAAPAVGRRVTASANFHVEPSFDPGVFELKIEWWTDFDGGAGIRTDSLDLRPLLVPGEDATDEHEWRRVEITAEVPPDARRGTVVIYFAGTSDSGTRQAARVDDLYVTTCD